MPKVPLTQALRSEYEGLFDECVVRPDRVSEVNAATSRLRANQTRYADVGSALEIPWSVIAVIHCLESNLDFSAHLHNGDPLTARTVHEPAGRPTKGAPPFTWEASAADALSNRGLGSASDWSLPGSLYQLEGYNGFGYRRFHPAVLSPYLWSFSNHYISGKYIKDGTWSDTAVSRQCGAAVLLRRLAELGLTEFEDRPIPPLDAAPLVVSHRTTKSRDTRLVADARRLQEWLNSFPGIFVKPDGIPGPRTSEAYKRVTGSYLPGDPRGN